MEGRADAAEAAPTVLVTGANGFLGSHCVWLLLHCGFNVRGTSRNIDSARSEELLNLVDTLQLPSHRFELVASDDLGDGGGWRALLQGCKYCIHTACPDLMYEMADASAVVAPAVIGARSLLMGCYQNNVEAVVMTSCLGAATGGTESSTTYVNENSWGDATAALPYARAKLLSEREAWEVQVAHERGGGRTRLATVLPGRLLGPLLLPTRCSSASTVASMLNGAVSSVPDAYLGFTDVRDAARLHVAALLNTHSNGRRVLACTAHRSLQDMAGVLHGEFAVDGYLVPTSRKPDCCVWLHGCLCRNAEARVLSPHLSQKVFTYDISLANDLCSGMAAWQPFEASVLDTAHTLLQAGLVRDNTPGRALSRGGLQVQPADVTGMRVIDDPGQDSARGTGLDEAAGVFGGGTGEGKDDDSVAAGSEGTPAVPRQLDSTFQSAGLPGEEEQPREGGAGGGGFVSPPVSRSESGSSEEKPGGVDAPRRWRQLRGAVAVSRGVRGGVTSGESKGDSDAPADAEGAAPFGSSGESK